MECYKITSEISIGGLKVSDKYYVVCSNCQTRNPLTNEFCNNCGEKLVKNDDSSKGTVTVFQDLNDPEQLVNNSNNSGVATGNDEDTSEEINKDEEQLSVKPKKRFCPSCGSEILDGAKFCHVCGFKLNNDNFTQEETNKNDTGTSNTQNYNSSANVSSSQQYGNNFISLIVVAILFIVAVSGYGIYKHVTYLPKGLTDTDAIMRHGSSKLSDMLYFYVEYHPQVINDGKYLVYIYKNTRTDRYVFPVRDSKDNSKHYCYLYGIVGTKYVVDINNPNWCYALNVAGIKIIGNNPSEWDYKMDAQYYAEHIKGVKEWEDE
nr:zinc ribbon domain-containing protein [Ligilactobacillus pobuzihii]